MLQFYFYFLQIFEASLFDPIKMTKICLEFDRINMTRRTLPLELDRNFATTNNIYLIFDSPIHVRHCGNIYSIFDFWSFSPIHARRCGNMYSIFGQVHRVNICRCQLFGHVHQFWSYSFDHLDSVK